MEVDNTKKDSPLIKICQKLDTLVAAKYGSSDETFYELYTKYISGGPKYALKCIASSNTAFDTDTDAAKQAVMDLLSDVHKIRTQKSETERATEGADIGDTIRLSYGGKDFGVLLLKKAKSGVRVTIKEDNKYRIYDTLEKFEFYLHDKTISRLFGYIKEQLKEEFQNYLSVLKPQIEAVIESETETDSPVKEEEGISEAVRQKGTALLADPELLVTLNKDLEKRISHDKTLRNVVLLTGESAYGQNPLNLFLEGPSSSGKTFVVTETLRYFPKKDIWFLGGLSATALVHDYGNVEEINGSKFKVVDLSRKILVFLEKPDMTTIKRLLPILSHDVNELEYRITDKNEKGQLVTMKAVLRGFPAVIFCTTESRTLKDLSTRNMLFAPEVSVKKIADVMALQKEAATRPWTLHGRENNFIEEVQAAMQVINEDFRNVEVAIPDVQMLDMASGADPRIMRDFKKRLELIKACARLHAYQRVCLTSTEGDTERRVILASFFDILAGLTLFEEIEISTTTGLAPVVIEFFHKVLKPLRDGTSTFSYIEMQQKHLEVYNQMIGSDTLRKDRIDPLEQAGYITSNYEETDRRKKYFTILRDIPTLEISGKKRVFELTGISVQEMVKTWLNKGLKIEDVIEYVYRGSLHNISSNDSNESFLTDLLDVYLHIASDIRYFENLFPAFKTVLKKEETPKPKTPVFPVKSGKELSHEEQKTQRMKCLASAGISLHEDIGYEEMGGTQ